MATPATAIVRTTTLNNTSHQNNIHGRKRTTGTSLPDDDDDDNDYDDDDVDAEESFYYIGEDNGFSISSSVAYSDLSVSYYSDDDDDDDVDAQEVVRGKDEISAASEVEATVIERNSIAHYASAPSPSCATSIIWNDNCNIVLEQVVIISNQSTTRVSSLNGINHDVMVPTPSPPSVPEAAADTTPHQYRTTPRILTRSSLVYQQEDVDALSPSPERIARLCHEELMGEDDDDDYEDGLVDDDDDDPKGSTIWGSAAATEPLQQSVRGKAGVARKPTVVTRGKENHHVRNTNGRLNAEIGLSRSLKQTFLVSKTSAPPANVIPVKSIIKEAQSRAYGPPSFLSRMSSSRRPSIKSTADLEREKMHHMKPFKAQTIRGSSRVITSRYKTTPKPPLPSSEAVAPSSSIKSKSKFEPPTAPKPPSSYHIRRESRLYKPTFMRERVQTFGETLHQYLNYGLRENLPRPPQKKLISTAEPPSFLCRQFPSNNTSSKRSLKEYPKQFRARAIDLGAPNVHHCQGRPLPVPLPATGRRRETQKRDPPQARTAPYPFRLHTHLCAESTRPPLPNKDDLELSKQFRALPLPKSYRSASCSVLKSADERSKHSDV